MTSHRIGRGGGATKRWALCGAVRWDMPGNRRRARVRGVDLWGSADLRVMAAPPPPEGCIRTAVHRRRRGPLPPPAPLFPFQCLSQILLQRLQCQEDLRFKIFGPPSAEDHRGTLGGGGDPGRRGFPSQPPPPHHFQYIPGWPPSEQCPPPRPSCRILPVIPVPVAAGGPWEEEGSQPPPPSPLPFGGGP